MSSDFSIGVERRHTEAAAPVAASDKKPGRALAWLRQSVADGTIFLPLIAVALWALTHPFFGILGDAKFYIGRALADLDPAGVGRDMMFVDDGQSRFSVFPLLLDHLVANFGTRTTAVIVALLSMAAWIAALCLLARQFVAARFIPVVLVFVAVLPASYGAPWRFNYSEVLAVPRPFAEALVIAAIAALVAGRSWLAFLGLVAATLIHPIMALAGWGVFGIVLCRQDWRWRVAAAVAVALVLAGAFLGVPVLDRLVRIMDPDLRDFAASRGPLLFPTRWPIDFIGPLVVEATTVAIAASIFENRRRLVLIAVIAVGIGGIAAQVLLGDYLSLLLVVQTQLWRTAWLLAALGAFTLAIVALSLWQQGPRGHVTLAILAMAWLSCEESAYGAGICVVALVLHFGADRIKVPITWATARMVWAAAFALALFWNLHYFIGYARFLANMPADAPRGIGYFWSRRYVAFPILALVLALVFARRPSRLLWGAQFVIVLVLVAAVIRFWDDRAPFHKLLDANRHPPALMSLIASRDGEVLWINDLAETWFLTGRPDWASRQQGISTIFSPALALKWRDRMQFLVNEGLAEKGALSDLQVPAATDLPHMTRQGIMHLCARADAPAWIIAPVGKDTVIPSELKARYWRPGVPNFQMTEAPQSYGWHRILAYAVFPCAG